MHDAEADIGLGNIWATADFLHSDIDMSSTWETICIRYLNNKTYNYFSLDLIGIILLLVRFLFLLARHCLEEINIIVCIVSYKKSYFFNYHGSNFIVAPEFETEYIDPIL